MWIENFKETENSDNRKKFLACPEQESITIGASCTHTFRLPFSLSNYCKHLEVIYRQGIDTDDTVWLVESWSEDLENTKFEIIEDGSRTIVNVTLSPRDTQRFRDSLLDTYVQLKIITKDNEIFYDNPHYIQVKAPLRIDSIVGE